MIKMKSGVFRNSYSFTDLLVLLAFMFLAFMPSFFNYFDESWYSSLKKPSLTPPSWVFPIIWSLLFTLLGFTGFCFWQKRSSPSAKIALMMYLILIFLLCSWSIVFFGLKLIGWSLIVLGLTVLITGALTQISLQVAGKKAFYALVPLLLWTSFAFYLNLMFYSLNSY
mgnify:CR=1 FL=1